MMHDDVENAIDRASKRMIDMQTVRDSLTLRRKMKMVGTNGNLPLVNGKSMLGMVRMVTQKNNAGVMTVDEEGREQWIPLGCQITESAIYVEVTSRGFKLYFNAVWYEYEWVSDG